MIRLSSGLRTSMVTMYGLQAMMNYGRIFLFSGTQPESADDGPSSSTLGFISQDGIPPVVGSSVGGLQLAQGQVAGSLVKAGTWTLTGIAEGTATWWRFVWNSGDNGLFSVTLPRIDGAVGDSLTLSNNYITTATDIDIADFILVLPAN